ncbi:MAG TPA: glycosyltransferase family 39 protein [Candidatus Eisenbacteria bacterium]|nr:glycosyltransferase family 39 protein [Candidatus Eisenbacteria bacterium]
MSSKTHPTLALHLGVLAAVCGISFFTCLDQPFYDKGEPREALAVQDIVLRGEWLFPLKRGSEIPSKPPLFHWLGALTSRVAGRVNEFTVRLPSAVLATFGVVVTYVLGRQLFTYRVAFLGGIILSTTFVYVRQATTARVDMTLTFFITLTLALFLALYREFLTGRRWFYIFYAVLGMSALAKGPVGVILPALMVVLFLTLEKRSDLISRFGCHRGLFITFIAATGWYGIALYRGGEEFFNRQVLEENLSRFFGGSGHTHPFYYYVPYVFVDGLPWSFFLPFVTAALVKKKLLSDDNILFLTVWVVVVFVFFSISMGKLSVYLLPLYPGLSLITAAWFYEPPGGERGGLSLRAMAVGFGLMGLFLFSIALLGVLYHDSGWFLSALEPVVKPKDRADLLIVKEAFTRSGWIVSLALFSLSVLWLSVSHNLWFHRIRSLPSRIVLISLVSAFVARRIAVPAIAEARSYRSFVNEVNKLANPRAHLYLYGRSFNSDSVVFYRGGPVPILDVSRETMTEKIAYGSDYIIMTVRDWEKINNELDGKLTPLLRSTGTGPEGDAPLVLVRGAFGQAIPNRPVGASPRQPP